MLSKIGVLTSGGDAPGMNACIRAVVRTASTQGVATAGILNGYEGLVNGNLIVELEPQDVSGVIQRGGTLLGTARSAGFRTPEGRARAREVLRRHGIEALVVIGGDGTYSGAQQFGSEYPEIRIVGCPGTIDNDLAGTDFTIGFDTAVNTALEAIDRLRDTAEATQRLFFVEVMGRDAGFIALHTGLAAGAEAVLVPETPTDLDALIHTLEHGWNRQKRSIIVVVAEGDDAGGATEVAAAVKARFNYYDTRVCVLGHLQRGGSPTAHDRLLASQLGSAAVEALLAGKTGLALGRVHHAVTETPFPQAVKVHNALSPGLLRLLEVLAS